MSDKSDNLSPNDLESKTKYTVTLKRTMFIFRIYINKLENFKLFQNERSSSCETLQRKRRISIFGIFVAIAERDRETT